MFQGHKFIKLINEDWVLDLTEYVGYKVKTNDDLEVIDYKQAFDAVVVGGEIIIEKYMRVPVKVLREAANFIRKYEKNNGVLQ